MKSTETNDRASLERLFKAGNRRATAWTEPVVESWEPESSRREVRRFAVILVTGALLVGLTARYVLTVDAPVAGAPAAAVEPLSPRDSGAVATPTARALDPGAGANRPLTPKVDERSGVRRIGGLLVVDFDQVSLRRAVQILAAGTAMTVQGDDVLGSDPITVHWQGTDVRAAWQQVLGNRASFSMACPGGSCQVAIKAAPSSVRGVSMNGTEARSAAADEPSAEILQPEAEAEAKARAEAEAN